MDDMTHDTHQEHPSEDDLVLLFYGDTDPNEEKALTAHVDACSVCQPLWQEIRVTLRTVDAAAVPEPPADFERVMWARVQRELDDIVVPSAPWYVVRRWLPAGAMAAIVVALLVANRSWSGPAGGTTVPSTAEAATSQPERALLVAMDDHLERSELLLVELMNAPADEVLRPDFERGTADDLLWSGRLYRQTATHTGNAELAAMLEDLEGVLVEIARAPGELKRADLDALRARIEQDDLIFKVRVVTDEVRERQKTIVTATEGDL